MAARKKAVQRLTLQTVEAPGGRRFLLPGAFFSLQNQFLRVL